MSAKDSFVVVGGRKTLPKLHVHPEDDSGTLRYRIDSSTPNSKRQKSTSPSAHYGISGTSPGFGTPKTFDTLHGSSGERETSPTLEELKGGGLNIVVEGGADTQDSGYSGWKDSTTAKKKLRFMSCEGGHDGSYTEGQGSMWESMISPVQDLKNKLKGHQSFMDDNKKSQTHPQRILAGIVLLVLFSSIGFALFLGVHHFSRESEKDLNGKMKSIKYGTEKKLESLRSEGRLIDRDITDEGGEVLGGKKASIQYAYETKELKHFDLFELAARIETLSQVLAIRLKEEGLDGPEYPTDTVIQKITSDKTEEEEEEEADGNLEEEDTKQKDNNSFNSDITAKK